jgi:predicted ribosome quality control (RQC) complex YloA/Tae2 family protein
MTEIVNTEKDIIDKVKLVKDYRVILDSDLAKIYAVSTSRLNEQVKRNIKRFPEDFMFELSNDEWQNLKSQNATSSWGGRRKPPKVFTEFGAIMAANVLNSDTAINASIYVVRAFVKLRQFLLTNNELNKKLSELENEIDNRLDKQEDKIQYLFETLKKVLIQEKKPKNKIGFISNLD